MDVAHVSRDAKCKAFAVFVRAPSHDVVRKRNCEAVGLQDLLCCIKDFGAETRRVVTGRSEPSQCYTQTQPFVCSFYGVVV